MRHFGRILFLFPLLPGNVLTQEPDVAPTDLEDFLSNPNVVVESEHSVGQIESLDSIVTVVAIEAQDRANPGTAMRGVRIELHNNAWNQTVYLDRHQLAELAEQLDMMVVGRKHERKKESPTSRMTIGTELCWMPSDPRRILCPSYTIDKVGETLSISVLGESGSFPLPGGQIADLAQIIEMASEDFQPKAPLEANGAKDGVKEIEHTAEPESDETSVGSGDIESSSVDKRVSIPNDAHVLTDPPCLLLAVFGTFVVAVAVLVFARVRLNPRHGATDR